MTLAREEVHVGDIGTQFLATVLDQAGALVNLGGASVKQFTFKKPDGATVVKTAALYTDGADGKMHYLSVTGDLDIAGPWQLQGYVEVSGGKWHTDVFKFTVYPNLA